MINAPEIKPAVILDNSNRVYASAQIVRTLNHYLSDIGGTRVSVDSFRVREDAEYAEDTITEIMEKINDELTYIGGANAYQIEFHPDHPAVIHVTDFNYIQSPGT